MMEKDLRETALQYHQFTTPEKPRFAPRRVPRHG